MGWVAIAMLGSCLGFLPYNFGMKREAGIFLGDTGSTFIGFVLAAIAVKGEWAVTDNEIVSFSAPVLIFWILIFDMTYITVERIMTGKVRTFREWIDLRREGPPAPPALRAAPRQAKSRLFHLFSLRDPGDQRHRAAKRPHDRQHPAGGPGLPHHGDHLDHRVFRAAASLARGEENGLRSSQHFLLHPRHFAVESFPFLCLNSIGSCRFAASSAIRK